MGRGEEKVVVEEEEERVHRKEGGGEESSSVRLNSSGGCVYCHWLKSCMVLKGLPSPPLGGSEQPAAAVFPLDEKLA